MTTLASVLVMVLTIVAGALWLVRPLRADGEPARPLAGLRSEREGHVPATQDLLDSMRRHPSALPAPGRSPIPTPYLCPIRPAPNAHPTPHLHARARVVFATARDGHLLLDCVVSEPARGSRAVPAGLPITLSLGALDTPWLAVHIEAMLERWADGERVVDLELLDSPMGPRATLVSASSRLVLPLATVAGLS